MKFLAAAIFCTAIVTSGPSIQAAALPEGGAVWFDLTVADAGRAEGFYGEVFGWDFVTQSSEYTVIQDQGRGIGGLYHPSHGVAHGGVAVYFKVSDLIGTLGKVVAQGGRIVLAPAPLPSGNGVIAVFLDLDGNSIGLVE